MPASSACQLPPKEYPFLCSTDCTRKSPRFQLFPNMSDIYPHPSRLCLHNWLQCTVPHSRSPRKASRSIEEVCTMLNYDVHPRRRHVHHISAGSHQAILGVFLPSRYPLISQERPLRDGKKQDRVTQTNQFALGARDRPVKGSGAGGFYVLQRVVCQSQ